MVQLDHVTMIAGIDHGTTARCTSEVAIECRPACGQTMES